VAGAQPLKVIEDTANIAPGAWLLMVKPDCAPEIVMEEKPTGRRCCVKEIPSAEPPPERRRMKRKNRRCLP